MGRRLLASSLLLALGCGDDSAPPPSPFDAGPDAGAEASDAGPRFDGEVPDIDAGPPRDTGPTPDTGPRPDAGPDGGPDAGPDPSCYLPDGGFDFCACALDECTEGSCGGGEVCLEDGCGRRVCQRQGARCVDEDDCAPGASCASTSFGGVCTRDGDCTDPRDCPLGFSCDDGTCVDRRLACSTSSDCPYGFRCSQHSGAANFCFKAFRRCANDGACQPDELCVDVDGDGMRECRPSEGIADCDTNDDCVVACDGADCTCGAVPDPTFVVRCQLQGPCQSGDVCGDGFSCADAWGDGVTQCLPTTGSTCTAAGDCPSPQVCATTTEEGPLGCVGPI